MPAAAAFCTFSQHWSLHVTWWRDLLETHCCSRQAAGVCFVPSSVYVSVTTSRVPITMAMPPVVWLATYHIMRAASSLLHRGLFLSPLSTCHHILRSPATLSDQSDHPLPLHCWCTKPINFSNAHSDVVCTIFNVNQRGPSHPPAEAPVLRPVEIRNAVGDFGRLPDGLSGLGVPPAASARVCRLRVLRQPSQLHIVTASRRDFWLLRLTVSFVQIHLSYHILRRIHLLRSA